VTFPSGLQTDMDANSVKQPNADNFVRIASRINPGEKSTHSIFCDMEIPQLENLGEFVQTGNLMGQIIRAYH